MGHPCACVLPPRSPRCPPCLPAAIRFLSIDGVNKVRTGDGDRAAARWGQRAGGAAANPRAAASFAAHTGRSSVQQAGRQLEPCSAPQPNLAAGLRCRLFPSADPASTALPAPPCLFPPPQANSGHPGLPMGCAPMSYVLWKDFMTVDPKQPKWFNRDRFVLSAGHGSMLNYSLLHLMGYDLSVSCRLAWQFSSRSTGAALRHRAGQPRSGAAVCPAAVTRGSAVPPPHTPPHPLPLPSPPPLPPLPPARLQIEDLKQFRQWGSKCPGHPENFLTQGVEVTTGPLGQGIANGVGLATAEANLAARFNKPDAKLVDHYT